jgi:hypothetical protein
MEKKGPGTVKERENPGTLGTTNRFDHRKHPPSLPQKKKRSGSSSNYRINKRIHFYSARLLFFLIYTGEEKKRGQFNPLFLNSYPAQLWWCEREKKMCRRIIGFICFLSWLLFSLVFSRWLKYRGSHYAGKKKALPA